MAGGDEGEKIDGATQQEIEGLTKQNVAQIHELEQRLKLPGKSSIPLAENIKVKPTHKHSNSSGKGKKEVKTDEKNVEVERER